jgi:hypothetical protein
VGAVLGLSVGTVGDVNGDGYDDLFATFGVGARVLVFHGSASGPSGRRDWRALGDAIGSAGDINRDGFDDVIVGEVGFGPNALVLAGSPGGLGREPILVIEGTEKNEALGASVGTAGDVNADGSPDLLVGDPFFTNDQDDEGAAFVYGLA